MDVLDIKEPIYKIAYMVKGTSAGASSTSAGAIKYYFVFSGTQLMPPAPAVVGTGATGKGKGAAGKGKGAAGTGKGAAGTGKGAAGTGKGAALTESSMTELDNLFLKEPTHPIFNGIFAATELAEITAAAAAAATTTQSIAPVVRFIPERLHLDDTVDTIKRKILLHLTTTLNASFDEIYLFIEKNEEINTIALYHTLTKNDKYKITRTMLEQFLLNINVEIDTVLPNKPEYTYSDLQTLNLSEYKKTTRALGQYISLNTNFPTYAVNPYKTQNYEPVLEKFAEITTTNQTILLKAGEILQHTIYMCLAPDVLQYALEHELSENTTVKFYFPYLYEKNLVSLELIKEQQQQLLADSAKLLNKAFQQNKNNINLFYDVYAQRKEPMPFTNVGIKSIVLKLMPPFVFNLPLDIVFKIIHATQDIPLIKYNPSKTQENIFRLYTNRLATNGKKIPYLDKSVIFKWDKVMGRYKSVAVFIDHYASEETMTNTPIICEFEYNGDIIISCNFSTTMTIAGINELFATKVNAVITTVNEYLSQSGYNINNFRDLRDKNVEILNIDYGMEFSKNKIKIASILSCVSSAFNVLSDNLSKKNITMRFKRVENYNETEGQEALIIDMSKPHMGYTDADIINALKSNFLLSDDDAYSKYTDVKRAQEVMRFANRKLKSRNNPGFLTEIVQIPFTNNVTIQVSGINDIGYLDLLYIYLDALIRISLNVKSTNVSKEVIATLCNESQLEEDKPVEDIIPETQLAPREEELFKEDIFAQEVVFGKKTKKVEEEEVSLPTVVAAMPTSIEPTSIEPTTVAAPTSVAAPIEDDDEEELDEADLMRFGYNPEDIEDEENEEEMDGGASDDEEEEDDEEEDEEEEDEADEGEDDLGREVNLTGQSLTNPNPFSKRIKKRDKNLFYTDDGKKNFKAYARTCPWNVFRQPVILTEEEKQNIDAKHPGSYKNAVKYGSDPNKQFWYICPRYWNLKDNTSLTQEEVDKNYSGNIIPNTPKKSKKVPENKFIFEFNSYKKEHLDENDIYIDHSPGFLKPSEKGKCLPCCFKTWDGPEQTERRKQCTGDKTIVVPKGRKKKVTEEGLDEYILSHDKFPISQENRYGFLPPAIQQFLDTDNKQCQISEKNTNIKQNHPCLLRHSVEISQNQSFIACIADIWSEEQKADNAFIKRPSVKEMKQKLIEALDIDRFVTLQNGNLIKIFYNYKHIQSASSQGETTAPAAAEAAAAPAAEEEEEEEDFDIRDFIDRKKYVAFIEKENPKIYQYSNKTNDEQMNALIKTVIAYENFKKYLEDDTIEIDYKYLWDLICQPNPKLFKSGVNMAIIELSKKDITDSVEFICPSNHYASTFFERKKFTIIIMKIDNFYEPIYKYTNVHKKEKNTITESIDISHKFNLHDPDILPNIKNIINSIKKTYITKCKPHLSKPTVYKFEHNIPLETIINKLVLKNYTIESQVLNYDSKVIGVVAINQAKQSKGFIPCMLSPPIFKTAEIKTFKYKKLDVAMNNFKIIWMDDVYVDTYENTHLFLTNLYLNFNKEIPCKPMFKVIEDEHIVGILTMTNQFVMTTPSDYDRDKYKMDDTTTKPLTSMNYIIADKKISTSENIDTERELYIKKIRLETMFYNIFRNLVKQLLGLYENNDKRLEIKKKSEASTQLYLKKIGSIETELKALVGMHVVFHAYDDAELMKLTKITSCYNKCSGKAFCKQIDADHCALMIPEINLINGMPNSSYYFGKLADEIVRYSRIRTFMFQPKSVLSFSSVKYNLNPDEIILLQTLLNQDYFEDIIPAPVNKYITQNTYETTQPINSQSYTNVIDLRKPAEDINDAINAAANAANASPTAAARTAAAIAINECKYQLGAISGELWKKLFPVTNKERVYENNPRTCSFEILLEILKNHVASSNETTTITDETTAEIQKMSKNDLKEALIVEYTKLYPSFKRQLMNILNAQGKPIMSKKVLEKLITLETMIMDETYYLTNLDMWLLITRYNIPMVFLSSSALIENGRQVFVANTDGTNKFYFVKSTSARKIDEPPTYTIIVDNDGNITKLDIDMLRDADTQYDIRNVTENGLIDFITNFTLTETKQRTKMIYRTKKPAPATTALVTAQTAVTAAPAPAQAEQTALATTAETAQTAPATTAVAPPLVKKLRKKTMM